MSYVVCDIAKSSPFCIWEGEGGRTGRWLQTRLRIFQVVWVLLRDGVCEGRRGEGGGNGGYIVSSTSNSRKCNQNGLQTSRILNFMIHQNCTPRCLQSLTFALPAWLFSLIAWSASGCVPSLVHSCRVQKMAKKSEKQNAKRIAES